MISKEYLNRMTAYEFLTTEIAWINKEKRLELYKNPDVSKKLIEYLKESEGKYWEYFRKLNEIIDIDEIFIIFPDNILIDYLNNNTHHAYVFFCAMFEKNTKKTLEILLNNDTLFIEFVKTSEFSNSAMRDLSAMDAFKIIVKMKNLNLNKKDYSFVSYMNEEEQGRLIEAVDTPELLAEIIDNVSTNKKQEFFMNDKRAIHIYKYFDIVSLVSPKLNHPKGIKLSKEILNDKDFFDKIKTTDIIQMRKNINIVMQTNPSIKLRENLEKYYDEIIAGYDKETDMLEIYKSQFEKYGNFAKNQTSNTISKLVVDALFEDNLNNVKINIKEILRYHDKLDKKIIDSDMIELYKIILEIETLSNEEKIQIYQKFKDKELNTAFYMHLRKLKNLSYSEIKSKLFNTNKREDCIIKSIKEKHGIEVYDLTDKEYTMLIRCIGTPFREESRHRRDCYTLISNTNNQVFNEDGYVYGYDSFDIEKVTHVNESDSFSTDDYQDFENTTKSTNRIMTPEEIINNFSDFTRYSEIQIINKKSEIGYKALKPSYVICYDEISSKALEESKRLNIPICIIKRKLLDKPLEEQIEGEKYII